MRWFIFLTIYIFKKVNCTSSEKLSPANVRDYSSSKETRSECLRMILVDEYADGWNGAVYSFSQSDQIVTGTMSSGASKTDTICLEEGCYALSVTSGAYPSEISWTLIHNQKVVLSGGAPYGARNLYVQSDGNVHLRCPDNCWNSCVDPCVQISVSNTFELVGGPSVVSGGSGNDSLCLESGCYSLQSTGTWSLNNGQLFTGDTNFYVDQSTITYGCDLELLLGVCEQSGDIDYIGLGIYCSELGNPSVFGGCICRGAIECESCIYGYRYLNDSELTLFYNGFNNKSTTIPEDWYYVYNYNSVETATVIRQHTKLYVQGVSPQVSILDAKDNTRHFIVEAAASLQLQSLTLQNGFSPFSNGGSILVGRFASLIIKNTHFDASSAAGSGGAIFLSPYTNAIMYDSSFQHCISYVTSSCPGCGGGAIFASGNLALYQTIISDCSSYHVGGALVGDENSTIELVNSTIKSCATQNFGGCIHNRKYGQLLMNNTTLAHCQSRYGGCINYAQNTRSTITNSEVFNCYAQDWGGAINIGDSSKVTLVATRISDSTSSYYGGCISSESQVQLKIIDSIVQRCTLSASFANGAGISLWNKTSLTLLSTHVSECSCLQFFDLTFGGGIYTYYNANVFLRNSTITNSSCGYGGALSSLVGGTTIHVQDSTISGCSATSSGGGIQISQNSQVLVSNTRILECVAENGAAISADDTALIRIENGSIISDNYAFEYGGSLLAFESARIQIVHSKILRSAAGSDGGLIFGADIEIQDSYFADGICGNSGGFILLQSSSSQYITKLYIINSIFVRGFTSNLGGCLAAASNSRIKIESSTFALCTAHSGGGGAIGMFENSDIQIFDSAIREASARQGGAIATRQDCTVLLSNDTHIENCDASWQGGAIYVHTRSRVVVSNTEISYNRADDGGGIYLEVGAKAIISSRSVLSSNVATTGNGGSIAAVSGTSQVILLGDVQINNNSAAVSGGGIALSGDNDAYVFASSVGRWISVDLDFSTESSSVGSTRLIIYSQNNRKVYEFFSAYGYLKTEIIHLEPGEYEFAAYSERAYGWGSGKVTLTYVGANLLTDVSFEFSVPFGSHVCSHSFVIPISTFTEAPQLLGNIAQKGGASSFIKAAAYLYNVSFIENTATSTSITDGGGGSLHIDVDSRLVAQHVKFINNSAINSFGGAVYAGILCTISIDKCMATRNVAKSGGFASFFRTADVAINSSSIQENIAVSEGAGVSATSTSISFSESDLNKNYVNDGIGGALALSESIASFGKSTVCSGNEARYGGCLSITSDTQVAVEEEDDCIDVVIQFDFRFTNGTCSQLARTGFTCDSTDTLSCSSLEAQSYIGDVSDILSDFNVSANFDPDDFYYDCRGCACDADGVAERGLLLAKYIEEDETYSTYKWIFGDAGAIVTESLCLEPGFYAMQSVDLLERSMDGASWSVIFESDLHFSEYGYYQEMIRVPDGSTHYVGGPTEGKYSQLFFVEIRSLTKQLPRVVDNRAILGGGGLLIDQGDDVLPFALDENVLFANNTAIFGSDFATPPRYLSLVSSPDSMPSGASGNGILIVGLRDRYDQLTQITTTDIVASVEIINFFSPRTSLSGTTSTFIDGLATFSELRISATPGTNVTLRISTGMDSLDIDEIVTVVAINDCNSGEEKSEIACTPCPQSEYSFRPDDTCQSCPKNAYCPGHNSIIPDVGYWKSIAESTNIRRCPHRRQCIPNDLLAQNDTYLHPNAQCAQHHRGVLCAQCENSFVYDTISGECTRCRSQNKRNVIIFLFICVAAIVIIIFVRIFFSSLFATSIIFESIRAILLMTSLHFETLQACLKILISFYDITSKISFPSVRIPKVFAKYQIDVSVFGLDIGSYFRRACFGSFDHIDLLYGVTLIPLMLIGIGIIIFLVLRYFTNLAKNQQKLTSRSSYILLIFLYLILTTTSRIIIQTLVCDDNFDDDSESESIYYRESYLYSDYSVSCKTRRWRVARLYASFMIFLYPFGIPAFFLVCLLSIRNRITPKTPNTIAQRTIKVAGSREAKFRAQVENVRSDIIKRQQESIAKKGSTRADTDADYVSMRTRLITKLESFVIRYLQDMANRWQSAKDIAESYMSEERNLADNRSVTKKKGDNARLDVLSEALVLETRMLDDTCMPFTFLFQDYGLQWWAWEPLFECVRRIVLTCLLPFPGTDADSYSQFVIGCAITLIFLTAFAYVKPFTSVAINSLETLILFIICLNYLGYMILWVDDNLTNDDDSTGLKGRHIGIFLVITNALLVPIGALLTIISETGIDETFSQRVHRASESSPRTNDHDLGYVPVLSVRENEGKAGIEVTSRDHNDWDAIDLDRDGLDAQQQEDSGLELCTV